MAQKAKKKKTTPEVASQEETVGLSGLSREFYSGVMDASEINSVKIIVDWLQDHQPDLPQPIIDLLMCPLLLEKSGFKPDHYRWSEGCEIKALSHSGFIWMALYNIEVEIGIAAYDLSATNDLAKRVMLFNRYYLWDNSKPVHEMLREHTIVGNALVALRDMPDLPKSPITATYDPHDEDPIWEMSDQSIVDW